MRFLSQPASSPPSLLLQPASAPGTDTCSGEPGVRFVDPDGYAAPGGWVAVFVPSPGPGSRGRLAHCVEAAIEAELERLGAGAPGVATPDLDGSLSDQLYRTRGLGFGGLSVYLPSLEGLTNLAGALDAEDSAVLRWWLAATSERPLDLALHPANRWLGVYGPPRPLEALVRGARALSLPPPSSELPESADLEAAVEDCAPTPVSGGVEAFEAVVPTSHAEVDVLSLESGPVLLQAVTVLVGGRGDAEAAAPAAVHGERAAGDDAARDAGPGEPAAEVATTPDAAAACASTPGTVESAPTSVESAPASVESAPASVDTDSQARPPSIPAVVDAEEGPPSLARAMAALFEDDTMAELRACLEAAQGGLARGVERAGRPLPRPPASPAPESARRGRRPKPEPLSLEELMGLGAAGSAAAPTGARAPTGPGRQAARPPIAPVVAPASERAAGLAPPLHPRAAEEWPAWVRELEAARGPKPLAVVERLFASTYVPLADAVSRGIGNAEARRALHGWAEGFSRSYSEAFDALRLRGKRPTMVLDAPEVAHRLGRLHGARAVQLLLVDGLRWDLGLRATDHLAALVGERASLAERTLLWSALPSVTAVQLDLLGKGPGALRDSADPASSELPVARGRTATTPRRIRAGSRELFKLDLVEASLSEPGPAEAPRLDALATDLSEALAAHLLRQPPRTLVLVFGDHGFLLDPLDGGTAAAHQGGASPEEVLVPAFAWLVGEVH